MFEHIFGFTCVENQVLAQLQTVGFNLPLLYHAADIRFETLFDHLILRGEQPDYLESVPKIQDMLKDRGVIALELQKESSITQAMQRLQLNQQVFIRVKPAFVKEQLHARGFRPDHFVLCQQNDAGYTLYNDLPETTALLSGEELENAYDGEYFIFSILRPLHANDFDELVEAMDSETTFPITETQLTRVPNIAEAVRNFFRMYKLVLYRLTECLKNKSNLQKYRSQADNNLAAAEYLFLRKSGDVNRYVEMLNQAYFTDFEIRRI